MNQNPNMQPNMNNPNTMQPYMNKTNPQPTQNFNARPIPTQNPNIPPIQTLTTQPQTQTQPQLQRLTPNTSSTLNTLGPSTHTQQPVQPGIMGLQVQKPLVDTKVLNEPSPFSFDVSNVDLQNADTYERYLKLVLKQLKNPFGNPEIIENFEKKLESELKHKQSNQSNLLKEEEPTNVKRMKTNTSNDSFINMMDKPID